MYLADHDIELMAGIATPTNWTRHRGPFAPYIGSPRISQPGSCMLSKRLSEPRRHSHTGGCQNYGPFLGPEYNTAPRKGPQL